MKCKRDGCENPVREYVGRGPRPSYCSKDCQAKKNHLGAEVRRSRKLKSKYGLTVAQYDQLMAEQGGRCAICGTSGPDAARWGKLVVDHDHETGEVRGLLCSNCNCAIGLLGDSPEVLRSAAEYLVRRGSPEGGKNA